MTFAGNFKRLSFVCGLECSINLQGIAPKYKYGKIELDFRSIRDR